MYQKLPILLIPVAIAFGILFGIFTSVQGAVHSPALEDHPPIITIDQQESDPGIEFAPSISTASDEYLRKFNHELQTIARLAGEEVIDVRLLVTSEIPIEWPEYIQAIPRAVEDDATGLQVWYGRVQAKFLAKLASLDFLAAGELTEKIGPLPRFRPDDTARLQVTEETRERLRDLRDNPPPPQALAPQEVTGWWDVGPGHSSKEAWAKGYTGSGVRVADIDSGVDFCHPDLVGTWATYSVASSRNKTYGGVANYYNYFDGWPLALSPVSNHYLFYDMYYYSKMSDLYTFAYGITKFADTSKIGQGEIIEFDHRTYTTTGTAASGTKYHIGYHPDPSLEDLWEERVGVLVVDENGDNIYESVYVDLNDNQDFRDDKRTYKASPTACWDADADGYNDVSGGLVYFIADGLHWPQGMDWWWNPTNYPTRIKSPPPNGDLVAFMFDDPLGPAEGHGTLIASNIAGQGVIDGDPSSLGSDEVRPAWKPGGVGGMVQGAGKDAKLIAIGDIYWNFEDSTEVAWFFASYGVDGNADTDDGAQITSNSYGQETTDNDEWDNRSRMLTRQNTRTTFAGWYGGTSYSNVYGQRVAHLFSTGNGAPGYGTSTAPSASTAILVGASTQMGSTDWDSISGPGQIVWGDVAPWSNRGPTAVGHLSPHVTADGAFAAGAVALNSWGDGWTAWETWGGTSRATPVAAGNLALIYQAWKQRTGSWPTWQEARQLLMSGATDQLYDVLVQGAGMVDADKATDIAAGLGGLRVSPSFWYPGSFRGTDYLAFTQILGPGGSDSQVFTLYNYSTQAQTATLQAKLLEKISSYEFTVDADSSKESPFEFDRPDYLFNLNTYAPSGIPSNTVLMRAELILPFDQFEPQSDDDNENNNNWYLLWYSHTDLDADGKIYNDGNGNGVVNANEAEAGEYVRFTYAFNDHTYRQASVKDPLDPGRWKDGIYLGLQHRWHQDSDVPVSNLRLRVTFYKKSSWSWLAFSRTSLLVPSASNRTVAITATVPSNTPFGLYEGAIEMSDGSYDYIAPIVINVGFTGDLVTTPLTLGGNSKTGAPYDNSYINGAQDWGWRADSGDWRFFYLDQSSTPASNNYLVVKDEWGDSAPESDIDTIILGQATGAYTNTIAPITFSYGDFSATDPATFGPYRLETIARSPNKYQGSGIWEFETASDTNVDYVVTEFKASGLHEIMQHTVRYEGDLFEMPFTKTLSVLRGPIPSGLTFTNYFTRVISFTANITHTQGITVEGRGLSETRQDFNGLSITPDPTNGDVCDYAAGGIYTYTTSLGEDVYQFLAYLPGGTNDLDLYLFYDSDSSGTFECPQERIAASTNRASAIDQINLSYPEAGNYMVLIQGFSVESSPAQFSWYWRRTDLDGTINIRNADLTINPTKPAIFELYNENPSGCNPAQADCNDGLLFVGFPEAPRLLSFPVVVNYSGPNLATSTKAVNPSHVYPGGVLTYTVNLINSSASYTATGAALTDTLPSQVAFGGIVLGGATYSHTIDAVLWNGNISPSTNRTIVYTATMRGYVADGTIIANTAEVNNGLGRITTIGPANTEMHNATLSSSTKAVNKSTASSGEILTYTLVLRDAEPIAATNAVLTDVLPEQTSFITVNGGATYSETWHAVLWKGTVSNTNPVTITYRVQINSPLETGRLITNTARTGNGLGSLWWTNIVTTQIKSADLSHFEKFASTPVLDTGEMVTYTLHLQNTGEAATTATITDSLPVEFNLVGSPTIISGPGSVIAVGDLITWTGTLEAGYFNTEVVIRFVAIRDGPTPYKVVTNTAYAFDTQGNTREASVSITVNYEGPDLESESEKLVDRELAYPGEVLTYTINLTNTSSIYPATGVLLTDTLPSEVGFGGIVSGGATYSTSMNIVRWQGDIGPSALHTIVYTVTVQQGTLDGTAITNEAIVDNRLGNIIVIGPAQTEVPNADLSQFVKQAVLNFRMGNIVTYTLTLTNTGSVTSTATITDSLPAAFNLLVPPTIISGSGTVTNTLDLITWNGELGPEYSNNNQVIIQFTAEPFGKPIACQQVTNTAYAFDTFGNTNEAPATVALCLFQYIFPLIFR